MVNQAAAETPAIPAATSHVAEQGVNTGATTSEGVISVFERFRTYSGHRTTDAFTALFTLPANTIVRQQPVIAISDGRSAVIIAAKITPKADSTTNFSLSGATLVSLKKIKSDEWQIKALPERGTMSMALLVLHGADTITYPLTVAPPLPESTDFSPQGFQEYLEKSRNSETVPIDLNGDGRNDFQDDYIYTANFLANQQASGRDRDARKQRALQRTLLLKPAVQKPEFDPKDFPD